MDHNQADEHTSLRPDDSIPSDFSPDSSSTFVQSPRQPISIINRPRYSLVSPMQEEQDLSYHRAVDESDGLGIHNVKDVNQGPSIEVSFSGDSTPAVPNSSEFMLSPTFSRSSTKKYTPLGDMPEDEGDFQPGGRSRSPSLYQGFNTNPDSERLRRTSRTSTLSPYGPTGTLLWNSFQRPYKPLHESIPETAAQGRASLHGTFR